MHVSRPGPEDSAPRSRRYAADPALFDSRSCRCRTDSRRAADLGRPGARARCAVADQRVEECAYRARRGAGASLDRGGSRGSASLCALSCGAVGLSGGRLRRSDCVAGCRARMRRRRRRVLAEAPSVPADRRIPGHQPGAVSVATAVDRRARGIYRGRGRRPGDLWLARRDAGQSRAAAARLSIVEGDQARAELSLVDQDPALGECADRAQHQALRQGAMERSRAGRTDPGRACCRRPGRGRERREDHRRAQIRASHPVR